jgi:hypothetical protein
MKKRFSDYPRNVPKQLIRELRVAGNVRALERKLGVNNFYLYKLLNEGIEPTNPEIRIKMFLDKPRKPRSIVPKTMHNSDASQSWVLYMRHLVKSMATPTPKELTRRKS